MTILSRTMTVDLRHLACDLARLGLGASLDVTDGAGRGLARSGGGHF